MSCLRRRSARIALVLSGLLPLSAAAVAAQSADDRAALSAFRDSLAAINSLEALQPLEPKNAKGMVALTRQGLWEYREAMLGKDRNNFDGTLMTLDRALQADEKAVYPWYVMGLVRKEMWDRKFPSKPTPRMGAGLSYRRAAIDAYARAIKADSSFLPASEALARLINAMGHRVLPPEVLPPLRVASNVRNASPEVGLAISRLEYDAGRYENSLDGIGMYLRLGGDSGLGRLEQARSLYALKRRDEALRAYLEGAFLGDSVGRAAYRDDLAFIAYEWEMNQFDSLPRAKVGPWVTSFFRDRDALALRAENERLNEHMRRWVYVHANYLIRRPDDAPIHDEGLTDVDLASLFEDQAVDQIMTEVSLGVPRFTQYTRKQWEIDDRGVIYLRHGEPAKRVSSVAGPVNESWSYNLPEGLRVFHFLGTHALGTTAATTLVAALPMNADLLDARGDISTEYVGLAARIRNYQAQAGTVEGRNRLVKRGIYGTGADDRTLADMMVATDAGGRMGASVLAKEVIKNQKAIAAGVSTDGFPLVYKKSLEAIVQVYGVGFGAGETRRILAVFAVPGRMITPQPRPDGGAGLLYPIKLRIIAMDRERGIVRQLDTTRVFLSRDTLRGEQHLSGLLELPVPPGMYQVRALVTSPGLDAGASAGRDSINIPASPRDLAISDLILGREGAISWTYTGQKIVLNPLNAFPKGSNAELFYEAGGLKPGVKYEAVIAVRRPEDKPEARPAVEVTTPIEAQAEYQQVNQGIGLAQLKPGNYWLTVTLREKGTTHLTTRSQNLNILEK
jgi:tetratricopeptide (TPR) repeat protein